MTYARQYATHLQPLADRHLKEITRQELRDFLTFKLTHGGLRQPGRPMEVNSVKGFLVPLRKCLQAALDDGLILTNPSSRIRIARRKDRTSADALERYTRDELAEILRMAQEQMPTWFPVFLTAARTGLRVGEICGLQLADLNFGSRYIHVRRAVSRRILGTPKNGKYRRVDMSGQLAAVLQDYIWSREIADTVAGKEPTPWVFGSLETRRYMNDEFLAKELWPRLLRLAKARPLRFHALRHTFASLLIEQGESLAYVKDQLGHSSIQITVDIYGHLIPGANRGAVDRLDDPAGAIENATGRNPGATPALTRS